MIPHVENSSMPNHLMSAKGFSWLKKWLQALNELDLLKEVRLGRFE